MSSTRNFCIIAHIDHGKSTLADRFLEVTSTLSKREMKHGQMLDTMDLEQERGITIKLQPVRMQWKGVQLNLIDTPGHVDFQYEVSRSLAACEGAVLVVDATQGIEAQTLANTYLAMEHDLTIIPVINKIDLPAANVEKVKEEMQRILGVDPESIIAISAKEGTNVEAVLDRVIEQIPSPSVIPNSFRDRPITENPSSRKMPPDLRPGQTPQVRHDSDETKCLVFDSVYDNYKGVVTYVKVVQGSVAKGDVMYLLHSKQKIEVLEVGFFTPTYEACTRLGTGEIGYLVTGVKSVKETNVGDTVWAPGLNPPYPPFENESEPTPLPGYKKVSPFVYATLYPLSSDDYQKLRASLEKLSLNDSSLVFEPDSSMTLGHGFRCGFLGLLHMEIVQERLEREYGMELIITAPSVSYDVTLTTGEVRTIHSASALPDASSYESIAEPFTRVEIIASSTTIGAVMELVKTKRGVYKNTTYGLDERVFLTYEMPLAEVIVDFFDALKNVTSGYGSMSYEMLDFRTEDLVKLDILVSGDVAEGLSSIVHRSKAQEYGGDLARRLKEIIPRGQIPIAIQAAIGSRIIARETIPAYRKDVTGYLYGGDVSRKKKLLEKQKKGKKRMKMMGKVAIPQEAFLAVIKR